MQMAGLANLNGWRWIFIIEGILTILLGIAGYWLLVDFPDSKRATWAFLSDKDREWICARVQADRGDVKPQPFILKEYLSTALDIKIWAYAMIFFNTTTVTYALAYFLPLILNGNMGFSVAQAQCLVAPPYVLAGITMYAGSWVGDKYHIRGPIIIFNTLLVIIGLPIMGFASNPAARYFGVFLTTAGANSNVPAAMSYQANNIRGQWKRAFCSATFVAFGGIGGIAGSLVFRDQDYPSYKPGLYACIATSLLTLVIVSGLTLYFYILNGKADRGEVELEDHEVSLVVSVLSRVTFELLKLTFCVFFFAGGIPARFPLYLLNGSSLKLEEGGEFAVHGDDDVYELWFFVRELWIDVGEPRPHGCISEQTPSRRMPVPALEVDSLGNWECSYYLNEILLVVKAELAEGADYLLCSFLEGSLHSRGKK